MALGHWLKDYIGPHSGGSGGESAGPLIVKLNGNTLDHTWQEIADAPMVWLETTSGTRTERVPPGYIRVDNGTKYSVFFNGTPYAASSPNGYPAKEIS